MRMTVKMISITLMVGMLSATSIATDHGTVSSSKAISPGHQPKTSERASVRADESADENGTEEVTLEELESSLSTLNGLQTASEKTGETENP